MSKKAQKASPFGRGGIAQAMTERASPSPESRHAAISCLFGRAMLSLRLFLFVSILALSGAPRQLSQRESHWQAGPLPTGRPRPDMTQKGGPCYRGQQLRDNIPCQAVVILDSGALPFSDRVSFARSAWASPARQCLSLWERWHRASDDGEGKPVSREPPCSDKLSLWESDAIAAPIPLRQHPCPLRRSAPALPKGEPKGILPDGFSPFTQETGRFAQVLLIFFPQMWYIQSNLIFYGLTIFFTVQRRFLYVVLS